MGLSTSQRKKMEAESDARIAARAKNKKAPITVRDPVIQEEAVQVEAPKKPKKAKKSGNIFRDRARDIDNASGFGK